MTTATTTPDRAAWEAQNNPELLRAAWLAKEAAYTANPTPANERAARAAFRAYNPDRRPL